MKKLCYKTDLKRIKIYDLINKAIASFKSDLYRNMGEGVIKTDPSVLHLCRYGECIVTRMICMEGGKQVWIGIIPFDNKNYNKPTNYINIDDLSAMEKYDLIDHIDCLLLNNVKEI